MTFGTVTNFEETATVRFVRDVAASVETVWAALIAEDELSGWLAPTTLEAEVGGRLRIEFGPDQVVQGEVRRMESLRAFEYTWTFPNEPDSVVLFELTPVEAMTQLVLEHRLLPPDQAAGYGAGWHAHLDMLTAQVTGIDPVDWETRFNEVLGRYAGA